MKKYLLFAGSDYYPSGGWEDFIESSDSLDELHKIGKTPHDKYPNDNKYDWYHIVEWETKTIVYNTYSGDI